MKKILILLILLILAGTFLSGVNYKIKTTIPTDEPVVESKPSEIKSPEIIADNLSIPWDIAFLDNGQMLITERPGNLLLIDSNKQKTNIKIPRVVHKGEGGLLGIVLHPNFKENNILYLYMSTGQDSLGTKNAVIRYKFEDNSLKDEQIIVDNIPGAIYHDGGRMIFGKDGLLYITTGDATSPKISQDLNSLGGKILRVKDDGKTPSDNPFGSKIFSYGHRNPQGLAFDDSGRLWETEHGRSGIKSGLDEINLIVKGQNFGWPEIEGDESKPSMQTPKKHSGPDVTWAPASLVYFKNKLFFGGLKGEALYEATILDDKITDVKEHFKGQFGRIRTIQIGPDGMFYITTSNTDGRGTKQPNDDKIIRIDPNSLI